MATATILRVNIQDGTTSTAYVEWEWKQSNTDHYMIEWQYYTPGDTWFNGEQATVDASLANYHVYNAPSNATIVSARVKPVAKKNSKGAAYWTAEWSKRIQYFFKHNPPLNPTSPPNFSIEDYNATASVDNLTATTKRVEFEIWKDDLAPCANAIVNVPFHKFGDDNFVSSGTASWTTKVAAGSKYKVKMRLYDTDSGTAGKTSWSPYSDNIETIPAAISGTPNIKALSETSLRIDWNKVATATKYEIQYTTDKSYFDSSSSVSSTSVEAVVTHAILTGLESGETYYVRVRATNDKGSSAWTNPVSIVIGSAPEAPTTWSSTTTATVGDPLNLYWVHNTEDGSSQVKAQLELTVNGKTSTVEVVNSTDEDEKDKTSAYAINTSSYSAGAQLKWRVRTCGITGEYGDWSVQRTVDIYAPAALSFYISNPSGTAIDTLTSFPFVVNAAAGPNTQTPTGYALTITANESYEGIDDVGNKTVVNAGGVVYSKYFDTTKHQFTVEISAGDVHLENGIEYTISCAVAMNSGLTASSSTRLFVDWSGGLPEPNASIGYNDETVSVFLRPYCEDDNGTIVKNVTLSVYRREFDGSFTELMTGLDNGSDTYINDPHPPLDYARYRIVARSTIDGSVSYYDLPSEPIGEKSIIIQWDDDWSNYDTSGPDAPADPVWTGSMLKLPYNIDVADDNTPDVSLVKYIGRTHPVSYYGTQIESTSTWNLVIEKDDKETLYGLRRLSIWTGDAYVREPSGSGYWANVKVSFSQKHMEKTIPVSLSITRVAGGV